MSKKKYMFFGESHFRMYKSIERTSKVQETYTYTIAQQMDEIYNNLSSDTTIWL